MSGRSRKESQIESEVVLENQINSEHQEKENFGKHLKKLTRKYFAETSIHGLKYILEYKRNVVERIFWILATLSLWTFGLWDFWSLSLQSSRPLAFRTLDLWSPFNIGLLVPCPQDLKQYGYLDSWSLPKCPILQQKNEVL